MDEVEPTPDYILKQQARAFVANSTNPIAAALVQRLLQRILRLEAAAGE